VHLGHSGQKGDLPYRICGGPHTPVPALSQPFGSAE